MSTRRPRLQPGLVFLGLALLAGCNEYDLVSQAEPRGEPNPRPLETPTQRDRVVQVTTPSVDVLWIIDNSCSMQDEQTALRESFPNFMRYFEGSGLDYHVGVVSTDLDDPTHDGRLRQAAGVRYIDPETPDPIDMFSSMARLGTRGSATEAGMGAAYRALEYHRDGYNAGFLREEAALHAIVISDEDDQTPSRIITQTEFIEWLRSLKAGETVTTWSSIVNCDRSRPDCVLGTPWNESAGDRYIDVTEAIGGIFWEIHRGDWEQVLEQLGQQAAGLSREFFLSRLPVPDTLEVYVIDQGERIDFDEGEDWLYDPRRNSVRFLEYVPNALAEIFIDYAILAAHTDGEP